MEPEYRTTGKIRGQTIVLDQPLPFADGQRVAITLRPLSTSAISSPVSDEDRAILEEVYRDRGCSVECDS